MEKGGPSVLIHKSGDVFYHVYTAIGFVFRESFPKSFLLWLLIICQGLVSGGTPETQNTKNHSFGQVLYVIVFMDKCTKGDFMVIIFNLNFIFKKSSKLLFISAALIISYSSEIIPIKILSINCHNKESFLLQINPENYLRMWL